MRRTLFRYVPSRRAKRGYALVMGDHTLVHAPSDSRKLLEIEAPSGYAD